MDQPPFDTNIGLAEYLYRNLAGLELSLNQLKSAIFNSIRRGGMRRTTANSLGTLGASYVAITGYTEEVYSESAGILVNLAAGTLTFLRAGNYNMNVSYDASFTSDNNSTRNFVMRLFDATDTTPIPNANENVYVGAYAGGISVGIGIPISITPSVVGKSIRLELGGGSTFSGFVINKISFSAYAI